MVAGITSKLSSALLVLAVAVTASWAGASGASRRAAAALWAVNGPVDALTVSGHTLYVGGKFTQIAPRTGPLLAVSAASGARLPAFPSIDQGAVSALAGDGRGGWFVGGRFDRIGGVACANLAHVTGAMAVDRRFCPRPNDAVSALAVEGSTLYVGGFFSRAAGAHRPNLAALDVTSGRATSWVPPPIDGGVDGIAVRNGVVYLLGTFNTVGGKPRFSLAAVDVGTRKVTSWDPKAPTFGGHGDTSTRSIAATANAVYVGGIFDRIGGKKQAGLAALDPVTGRATSFAPRGRPWSVDVLAVSGGRLYAGGITHTGGYLTAYDAATGKAVSWSPPDPGGVDTLAFGGSRVYTGGERLAAFDATNGRKVPWAPPAPNQAVRALALSGKTVVVGGAFTGAGGVVRDGLAAVDLGTGQPTNWHPRVRSSVRPQPEIDAIALSGSTVYIGGDFDHVGGTPRTDVAAVDAASGQVRSWAPKITTDQVLALAVSGPNVYLGGFDVASSYDVSGKVRWNSPPTGIVASVNAIAVTGGTVYLGGEFGVIGGASRNALAAVDPRNGSAAPWNPKLAASDGDPAVGALAVSGSTVYVGGQFTSAGGAKRTSLASFDASGKWTAWAPKLADIVHVYAIAVAPGVVYAGGDGGAQAFDPKTGATLKWHPSVSAGGNFPTPFAHTIAVAGSTVYVGDESGLETFAAAR